jgi:methionyl-tRNA formyltransferase
VRLLLVGGESAGLQALKAIAATSHTLVGVLPSMPKSGFAGASVADLARKLGAPTWPAESVRDPAFAAVVAEAQVDLLLNVHSLYLINRAVLAAPRLGCFNLHPGPLPECAGLNAPSWAIQRGERAHGVTLHWMAAGIDTGPVAYCERFPIEDTDTGLSVALKCTRLGARLVETLLHAAASDPASIPRIPQDLGARRYFSAGPPDDGRIAWSAPARAISNFVRAADYRPFQAPWPHPRTRAGGREFGLASVRPTGRPSNAPPGWIGAVSDAGVEVACGDEWLLVREVQEQSRYQPAAASFASLTRLE